MPGRSPVSEPKIATYSTARVDISSSNPGLIRPNGRQSNCQCNRKWYQQAAMPESATTFRSRSRPNRSPNGFQNATSNQIITKFIWYGHFSLVESDSGKYTSLFYAKKTEHDDVLSLQWNITDEDDEGDFISISMPGLPPSNA